MTSDFGKYPATEDLRIFERVATRNGFAAAARELRLSPAVVTRRIAALEAALKVRLLTRTTRQVRLTQEGEDFLDRCRTVLGALDDAVDAMRSAGQGADGLLRLTVPLSFGRRHIAPMVRAFQARHPAIRIALCLSDSDDDLGPRDADLAIRIGPPRRGAFVTRKLLTARRLVVASPAYLAQAGTPQKPEELADHRCLAVIRDDLPVDHWMFTVDGRMQLVRVPVSLSSNSGEVIQQWALDGAGIALKSHWDLADDLASGRLVELLADASCDSADLFLAYPDRRNLPARVRLFIDFITDRMDAIGRGMAPDRPAAAS